MDYKIVIVIFLALAFLGFQFYMKKQKFVNGTKAPDFTAKFTTGESFKLSDQKGKYVLIDFWGTWCPSCKAELPVLKKVAEDFKNSKFDNASELMVVGIALEKNPSGFNDFIDKNDLHWMEHIVDYMGEGSISNEYGIKSVPTKYLINPKGQVMAYGSLSVIRKILGKHEVK